MENSDIRAISSMATETSFTSLGGVWLDELRWPGRAPQQDVVGGSATFAILGARLFASISPSQLSLIVQTGNDFPDHVLEQLRSWCVTLHIIHHPNDRSTRGILEHSSIPGYASFTRLTAPLLTSPADLAQLGILNSTFVHLFGTADMARSQCAQLRDIRQASSIAGTVEPRMIWEPHPKSCTPNLLADHFSLLESGAITVFSPNHFELCSFFESNADRLAFDKSRVESQANYFWTAAAMSPPTETYKLQAIIIRAAENGCVLLTHERSGAVWLPAFWSIQQQDRIVDPTGAGNSFLGGLAQGWIETRSWIEAACYATVAASITVEHVGVPLVEGQAEQEAWSGTNVRQRLSEYMRRAEVQKLL